MAPVSKLRMLRMLIAFNVLVFVAAIVVVFGQTKTSDGPLSKSEMIVLIEAGAWLITYLVGVTGLWFDKLWGRIALCVFLILDMAMDEPGETTRLSLVLGDLHTLSCGLILGLAFFGMPDRASAERRAVKDVFS